jgi:hypothetical protein
MADLRRDRLWHASGNQSPHRDEAENGDEAAMSIQGLITTNDVLRHPVLIVSSFGVAAYLRCCKAIMLGQKTTFLACAFG